MPHFFVLKRAFCIDKVYLFDCINYLLTPHVKYSRLVRGHWEIHTLYSGCEFYFLKSEKKVNGILKHIRTSLQVNFHTPLELKIASFYSIKEKWKGWKGSKGLQLFLYYTLKGWLSVWRIKFNRDVSPAQWGQFLQFYLQNVKSVKNVSLKTCNFNSLQTKSDIRGRGGSWEGYKL